MPIDYRRYNKNFREKSKYIRFMRAQNKCEHCGVENYKPDPISGKKVILTTAHLNHNITDDRDENLAALCQKCHFRHDLQDNIVRRKYGKLYQKYQILIPFINQLNINFNS